MVPIMSLEQTLIDTIVGPLTITGDNRYIHKIEFIEKTAVKDVDQVISPVIRDAVDQLKRYFSGTLLSFDIPMSAPGTDFQKKVWRIIQKIEYGQVSTYGDIAARLGNMHLSRAVGQAANRNPIPIVVPCHRVIGAKGALVGFAPGVALKEILLNHEQIFKEKRD